MKWLGILVAITLGLYGLYLYNFPSYTHRYRLTVEIEADGKLHTGSGVVEVVWFTPPPLSQRDINSRVRGRAALVDLGRHGVVLAALLGYSDRVKPAPVRADELALRAYFGTPQRPVKRLPYGTAEYAAIRHESGLRELSEENYPPFIWLPEPIDKHSARQLLARDFTRDIGPIVILRRVTLETTSDAFSNELFEKLPWFRALYEEEKGGAVVNAQLFSIHKVQLVGAD